MRVVTNLASDSALERSVSRLAEAMPEMSARWTLSRRQRLIGILLVLATVGFFALNALATLVAINFAVGLLYVAALAYKAHLALQSVRDPSVVVVSDGAARSIPDDDLPPYTVLIAAYHESGVIAKTIEAVERLEYPRDRLQVLLLLEDDDIATIAAARTADRAPNVEILLVPRAAPRTKPKACNYGLAYATGDIVTIYDAEDRPEPLQLRRAVAAFRSLPPDVACLQAKLSYHNPAQNLITRLFTVEYLTWFSMLLPALARRGGPIPLGGTSMHVRRHVLEAVGGWDPFNVTEDADLGVRLNRSGYRTEVLDSTTLEEANSDFINWVKQRSRWYKGYLQTWLVHMRHPLELRRQLGTEAFLAFNLTIGATPLVALLNPIFWLLTFLWFGAKAQVVQSIFPPSVYYTGVFCMIFGNFMVMYLSVIAVRATEHSNLIGAVALSPLYWAMMSIAAVKAAIQLLVAPFYWEKTTHGLDASPQRGELVVRQPSPSTGAT
jgi:cellulose synthase/poly-beta-1,6-N-acetylglucosamine synthase-like glycosyltransferase